MVGARGAGARGRARAVEDRRRRDRGGPLRTGGGRRASGGRGAGGGRGRHGRRHGARVGPRGVAPRAHGPGGFARGRGRRGRGDPGRRPRRVEHRGELEGRGQRSAHGRFAGGRGRRGRGGGRRADSAAVRVRLGEAGAGADGGVQPRPFREGFPAGVPHGRGRSLRGPWPALEGLRGGLGAAPAEVSHGTVRAGGQGSARALGHGEHAAADGGARQGLRHLQEHRAAGGASAWRVAA